MRTVFLFILLFLSTSFLYGISPATDVFLRRLNMQQTDVYKPISVFNYMKSMTIEEKIGQLFLLNLEGNSKFTEKTEYKETDLHRTVWMCGFAEAPYDIWTCREFSHKTDCNI